MQQLTPTGLITILGQVTAIMVIPIVGGAVAGLVADGALGTSPLYVLGGFVVGNLIAIVGLWLYIRAHTRDGRRGANGRGRREDGTDRS